MGSHAWQTTPPTTTRLDAQREYIKKYMQTQTQLIFICARRGECYRGHYQNCLRNQPKLEKYYQNFTWTFYKPFGASAPSFDHVVPPGPPLCVYRKRHSCLLSLDTYEYVENCKFRNFKELELLNLFKKSIIKVWIIKSW